jgi:hypothetical protein
LGEFLPAGRFFTLGSFFYFTRRLNLGLLFSRIRINFDQKGSGSVLGDYFTYSSGHPVPLSPGAPFLGHFVANLKSARNLEIRRKSSM